MADEEVVDPGAVLEPEVQDEGAAGQLGSGTPDPAQAGGWQTQALPAGHPGLAAGLKTWGDLDRRYESSSQEARRLAEEARQARTLAEGFQGLVQQHLRGQQQQGQGTPAQQAAATGYWGYGTREKWSAAMQADPELVLNQMMESRLKAVTGPIQQQVQETQQQAERVRAEAEINAGFAALCARDPAMKDEKSPQYQAWANFIADPRNEGVLKGTPPGERAQVAYQLATYGIQEQIAKAAQARTAQAAKAAGTPRPGSGPRGMPRQDGTGAQSMKAAIAKLREEGHDIPADWEQGMAQELENAPWVRNQAAGKR